jgi:hypothetical protein
MEVAMTLKNLGIQRVNANHWKLWLLSMARGSIALFSPFCFVLLFVIPVSLAASRQPQANSTASVAELASRANSGDVSAQRQLAQFLLHSNPTVQGYDVAIACLHSLASRNIPQARFLLGYLYEHGQGLPRNYAKAAENYLAAALQGHAIAQNNLASLYERGLGVPKNSGKAFELYLASAQQGNPIAQCNLASMYYTGSSVPRNFSEAARWFRAAAELGYPDAQHDLAVFYLKGFGVSADYREGLRWERLAAQQGYAIAETGLAYLYETGMGVPLDYVTAYTWYSRAVSAGDHSGVNRLENLSHLMTRKQILQAKAFLSGESSSLHTTPNFTNQGDDAVLLDGLGSIGSSVPP